MSLSRMEGYIGLRILQIFYGLKSLHKVLFPQVGCWGMPHYRLYLLDEHRHVISVANLDCADEQEAKGRAVQLVDANDVELWQLDHLVAVFEAVRTRASAIDALPPSKL